MLKALNDTSLFQQWKREHPKTVCSHFFAKVNSQCEITEPWDIGFYNPSDGKITVFTERKNPRQEKSAGEEGLPENSGNGAGNGEGFEEKPADDVFKAPADTIEALLLPLVKTDSGEILAKCRELLPQCFPGAGIGDGFLILQSFRGQTIWNISFVAAELAFLNLKFDAQSGEKVSHDVVSLKG